MEPQEIDPELVSVVLAVYNGEDYLDESIQSALAQSYRKLEILVVDDGSTDRTASIGSRFQRDDRRVRYLGQPHRGLPFSRNFGIRHARGGFIALLDHDDLWYPDKLTIQIPMFSKSPDLALVYSDYDKINPAGQTIERRLSRRFMKRGNVFQDLFESNFISSSTIVYRRDALEKSGYFDESLHYALDWHLSLRMAAFHPIDFVDESLAAWRWRPGYEQSHREIYLTELQRVVSDIGMRHRNCLSDAQSARLDERLARISAAIESLQAADRAPLALTELSTR